MQVGVLRETKDRELRVALLPAGARSLVEAGHEVLIETGAGEGSGFPDERYEAVGARIAKDARDVLTGADLVTKVKEPSPEEVSRLESGQALFCFLHLAPEVELTTQLLETGAIAIGYGIEQRILAFNIGAATPLIITSLARGFRPRLVTPRVSHAERTGTRTIQEASRARRT